MAARRRTTLMYGRPSAGRPSRISASAAIRYVSANRATKKSREPRVSLIEDLNGSWNLFKEGNMLSRYGPYRDNMFPSLNKFHDPFRSSINETRGSRDFFVARLAETYLIAAEALMRDGRAAEGLPYINAVRRR